MGYVEKVTVSKKSANKMNNLQYNHNSSCALLRSITHKKRRDIPKIYLKNYTRYKNKTILKSAIALVNLI